MSLPPDRPTEPLRPSGAPRQPAAYEPPPAPTVDVSAVLVRIEDAVHSVRTGLMVVGVIAVAALGVAIYALVKDNGADGTGGAGSNRVSQLDDRIDGLSRQVQDLRSGDSGGEADDKAVTDRVDALERTVKELADRPQPGDATQAVKELSDRIDDIAADVEQLKSAPTP